MNLDNEDICPQKLLYTINVDMFVQYIYSLILRRASDAQQFDVREKVK